MHLERSKSEFLTNYSLHIYVDIIRLAFSPLVNAPTQTKSELQADMALYQQAQIDFDAFEAGDPKR